MSASVLEARRVSYRAGRATLVRDASFEVRAGEVLALVGPNGAGKSTLLRLLSGELRPFSGEVRVAERSLAAWDRLALARTRAVLAQSYDLSFAFRAEDVVHLGRSPHHGTSSALRDRVVVELAMRASGSSALRDRSYPTLSGGEKQLVHAARAFAQLWEGPAPRVLLLDEPTASLDLAHQHALLSAARRLAADGCAIVCVLHDLNLAAQYADRVAVLARGSLRALGAPADALTTPLLADVFGVRAAVVPHPELPCPLIVSLGPIEPSPAAPKTKEMVDDT